MAQRADGDRLHVVILGLNYAPETTGIAPYTTGFARHLATEGHEVVVVTGHPHYPQWQLQSGYEHPRPPEYDHGVRLLRVSHPVPHNPVGFSRIWMEFVFAARAAVQLARQRPDVVVAVSPSLLSLLPAVLLRRVLRYRVGAWVQDLYGAALAETGIGGSLLARAAAKLELLLLRRVDGVIVIHDVFRRALIGAGLPTSKIEVVPNWAHVTMPEDIDRVAVRRHLGWGENEFVALHAGNMGAKQGLEGLIDVARLAEERASSVRIVLMGNGSRRNALSRYASTCAKVSIIDSLPAGQFEAALTAADCLLLHEKPGVVEMSVPSKLTTYFTAGRPIVAATDLRSGASALMRAAGAGRVVRAGAPEAVLGAIESLAREPQEAEELGQNGQQYAAANLTAGASLRQKAAWVQRLTHPDSSARLKRPSPLHLRPPHVTRYIRRPRKSPELSGTEHEDFTTYSRNAPELARSNTPQFPRTTIWKSMGTEKQDPLPVTVLVQTKNEALGIQKCLDSLSHFDEIIVVDSESTDDTKAIALSSGARVVDFHWDGRYPKKKQWQLENVPTKHPWVLFLDADETPSRELLSAIRDANLPKLDTTIAAAFDVDLSYVFAGRRLRFGHKVTKRALVHRERVRFPEVEDLEAPGMGELEGHYQPEAFGQVLKLGGRIIHDDQDPVRTWFDRHNRYSDWEAFLRVNSTTQRHVADRRTSRGRVFNRLPLKPLVFFFYTYILRLGLLDGRAGLDYAIALSTYYWQIGLKTRESRRYAA